MTDAYEEIVSAALALPPQARALLAEDLLASLDSSQAEIDEAWRIEIERRIQEIREGRVELLDGDKVMSELRAQLKR
jgi:putative addiction module component (TIGR02574 family)